MPKTLDQRGSVTYWLSLYEKGVVGLAVSLWTLNCMVKAALIAMDSFRGHCFAALLIGKVMF